MNYKTKQEIKARKLLKEYFKDPGYGIYYFYDSKNKRILGEAELVLSKPYNNLFNHIREDADFYFKNNKIVWWNTIAHPSGHLLSSQLSCINHLFYFRNNHKVATAFLKNLDPNIEEALILDDGYIEFEKVGKEKLGKEKQLSRGENCTSIDAMMLGKKQNGETIIFLIEWKYTELYEQKSLLENDKGYTRWNQYIDLLNDPKSPIKKIEYSFLFYEPFYQLMRQTLLAWQMTSKNEYGATEWRHIDVIPQQNLTLRDTITSSGLNKYGNSVEQVWKNLLKEPIKYIMTTPEYFISPALNYDYTKDIMEYLKMRYHF